MDIKAIVLENLKVLRSLEQANKQPFKVIAYSKVIRALETHDLPIYDITDFENIKGIGKGIMEKIKDILATGSTEKTKEALDRGSEKGKQFVAVDELTKVMAIGPVKAQHLVEQYGITSIDTLRNKLQEIPDLLTDKQKLGLHHHEDFALRIPRKEMEKHNKYLFEVISKIDESLQFEMAGSYRRMMPDSGDIDVLVTYKSGRNSAGGAEQSFRKVIEYLQGKKYLTDHFAYGESKYNGVARLPNHKHYRRIDFMYTSPERFPFALLYFTGSQEFNINMRKRALELSFSLNEYGLKPTSEKGLENKLNMLMLTEQDVFEFLKMDYVEPHNR
jgi:DNA polymerase/3'-5' exonuclease PolX